MTTSTLIKQILLFCVTTLLVISSGCKNDSTQPTETEAEKIISAKLSANVWHGVWYADSIPSFPPPNEHFNLPILCEEITFDSNKSCSMKSCDVATSKNWSVTEINGISTLSMMNKEYLIEKLDMDTLLIREKSTKGLSYLFLKDFKGYNRVKAKYRISTGDTVGHLGLECASIEESEISEYYFDAKPYSNPVSTSTILRIVTQNGTKVKIVLDDGQTDPVTVVDTTFSVVQNFYNLDLRPLKSGVYKITYIVKPPNILIAKTTYSYIFVAK